MTTWALRLIVLNVGVFLFTAANHRLLGLLAFVPRFALLQPSEDALISRRSVPPLKWSLRYCTIHGFNGAGSISNGEKPEIHSY